MSVGSEVSFLRAGLSETSVSCEVGGDGWPVGGERRREGQWVGTHDAQDRLLPDLSLVEGEA